MTTVSVCISNHNYARYVAAALDSVIGQEGVDVEIVVVDDGSTDESLDVLAAYRSQAKIIAQPNGGQASAMNSGFSATGGELVVFLDADDVLLPGALRAFVDAFAEDPSSVKVASRLRVIDGEGRFTGTTRPPATWQLPRGDLRTLALHRRSYVWPASSGNCYRRSALAHCMPIPTEDFRIEADLYLATFIVLEGPISALDEPVVGYRVHGSNNFAGHQVDGAFLRRKMERIERLHRLVVERSPASARPPSRVESLIDPAYLAYRLGSLVIEPDLHPHPGDRRPLLALRAAKAAATHPGHPVRSRVRRSVWAVLVGVAPRRIARRLLGMRFR